jgi:hypothetical protein
MQMLLKQGEKVFQQPEVEDMKRKKVVFQFYRRLFFRQQVEK